MCFTPAVSFLTFAVEIMMAFWVLNRNPKNRINQVSAAILIFLGLYQFTEYALCTSGNPFFWGKMGFVAYTFLPALGLHWAFALRGKKALIWPIHLISSGFALLALLKVDFIQATECGRFFVKVITTFSPALANSYLLYYVLFIAIASELLIKWTIEEHNLERRKILAWGFIGMLSFTVPTFLLVVLFPLYNIMFPSVLCQFAIFFAIVVVYVVSLNERATKISGKMKAKKR